MMKVVVESFEVIMDSSSNRLASFMSYEMLLTSTALVVKLKITLKKPTVAYAR